MASPSSSHLAALIQDVLRASPDAAQSRNQAAKEAQSPIGLGTGKRDAALSDTEKHLQFFSGALEYATFPHARNTMLAKSLGIVNSEMARGWITDQIKRNIMDPNWEQAPNLSKIADIFARTVELVGKCRFPLYLSKSKVEDWFLIWMLLNEQRMERKGWTFTGTEDEQKTLHPSMASFRRIAERDQEKAP